MPDVSNAEQRTVGGLIPVNNDYYARIERDNFRTHLDGEFPLVSWYLTFNGWTVKFVKGVGPIDTGSDGVLEVSKRDGDDFYWKSIDLDDFAEKGGTQ